MPEDKREDYWEDPADHAEVENEAEEEDDFSVLPDTPLQRALAQIDACYEAREWVGAQSLAEAWARCPSLAWVRYLWEQTFPHPRRMWAVPRCTCRTCDGYRHQPDCHWRMYSYGTRDEIYALLGTPVLTDDGTITWPSATIQTD